MSPSTLRISTLDIPFKQVFAHATATRTCTESILVTATLSNGVIGAGEGCPRQYVTGETIQSAQEFFKFYQKDWEQFRGLQDLQAWMIAQQDRIDENPAAWCAVELALLDLWGKERGQSLEALLGLPELSGQFQYSAVLGTENISSFKKQAQQFAALGFSDFKVKVTGNLDQDSRNIQFLKNLSINNLRIRLDANNLWKTAPEAVSYLKSLDYLFFAIEEPLIAGNYDGCQQISQELGLPIILDESFLRTAQFASLQADPKAWILNIRISKMGGILRSLKITKEAKARDIPIIVGAQVGETSLLTRVALTLANSYRDILLAQEGAFGTYLLKYDISDPPIMFRKGGRLDVQGFSRQAGLGITLAEVS